VLEVAHGLLKNEVKDENEVITTIALAAYPGVSWAEAANESSEEFGQKCPGLEFSRVVDGMPLFRMVPMLIEVVRYDGTELPKEIRIEVSSNVVTAETLAARYEETLLKERIPSENCVGMSLECSTDDLTLAMTVKPRAELNPHAIQHHTTYPQGAAYHFPPPHIIRGWYKELLGSVDPRTFRGIAYALGDHDRSQTRWKKPETNVVACLACCFGELDTTTRPAKRRPRISRALNRHLLSPYNITPLPDSWSGNKNLRKNLKKVGAQFMRASYLWQESCRPTLS
jgi:hypothetical protein